jgi:signal transduction histidine kinase
VVLYVVLGTLLSLSISAPLKKLKKAATDIQNGLYISKARISNRDEIGDLANAFNEMTVQIQQSMSDLKESEQKYRTILENIDDIYFRVNMLGQLQLASSSTAKMFYDREDRQTFSKKLMETGSISNYEVPFEGKNGAPRCGEINCHLIYDDSDMPIAAEGILRDITTRKQMEAAFREEKIY